MGRPPTKPTKLKDGWYIEVRNKGSKSGIKIRKESLNEMHIAVEEYERTKEVIVLGESKDGSWVNDKAKVKAAKAAKKK